MNVTMIAFGMASIAILFGTLLRSKIPFLKNLLVPVCVIAGVIGFIFMNTVGNNLIEGVHVGVFSQIVGILFTFSFISIGLASTKAPKSADGKRSGPIRGSIGMGLIWCILYALSAVIGVIIIGIMGDGFKMDSMYGLLIPFAFCQGPGQAAAYGGIFENAYGLPNAGMVALIFSVIGFMASFIIGVPLTRYGLKNGFGKNKSSISATVLRGFYLPEEQSETMGKVTTHSGSIETLSIHVAIMGLCYVMAVIMAEVVKPVPVLGVPFGQMVFFWGMISAYIVKAVMRKLNIEYLLDTKLQSKITGWTADYVVVGAFMAIQLSVIGQWMAPILAVCLVVTIVTLILSIYLGSRLGSDHDFERVVALYGTCTGTTPSGIALLRMIDPQLETSTSSELGMMNMAMTFSTPAMIVITMIGGGTLAMTMGLGALVLAALIYLALLKVFGVWNKPSFNLFQGVEEDYSPAEAE